MKVPFFTLNRQNNDIEDLIRNSFDQVFSNGSFILGEKVALFEKEFSKFIGAQYCVSCGNGTDALELILEGLGIENGDEVIIPDNTWMSLAEAILRVGGVPVCCDVQYDSFNLSVEAVEASITEKTFAIIVVHQYGQPADMPELERIKQNYGLFLIEDCAHAAGAATKVGKCGTLSDAASFSFYPTKNLGALGDGGAIVTNNSTLAEIVGLIRNHGQKVRDQHLLAGRNSRLDELQAAFLIEKLNLLDSFNRKRKLIAERYLELLKNEKEIILPQMVAGHIFHQFVIRTKERDALIHYLKKHGVGSAIHYPSTISSIGIAGFNQRSTPIASEMCKQVLSLPIFPELTMDEVNYTANTIKRFFRDH